MATIEASPLGGKWNETGAWVSASIPGEGDDVVLGSLSGKIEVSAEAKCRSLEASAYKSTLKITSDQTLKIGTSTSNGGLAMKLGAGMTWSGVGAVSFGSTSGTTEKITTAGISPNLMLFNGVGGVWELQDETKILVKWEVRAGELKTGGNAVTAEELIQVGGTMMLGASTITLNQSGAGIVLNTQAGTFTAETSTIKVNGAGTKVKKIEGHGKTYNILTIESEAVEVVSGFTVGTLNFNTAGFVNATKITKTIVVTVTAGVTANGKAGSLVKLESTTEGKPWEISKSSGTVSLNFLSLKDSHAVGGASWYAGTGSTSVSGNEGWKFESPTEVFSGTATLRAAGGLTATGAKTVQGTGTVLLGAKQAAAGAHITTGSPALRASSASIAAGTHVVAGAGMSWVAAAQGSAGAKTVTGEGRARAAAGIAAAGGKGVSGVSMQRTGASGATTGSKAAGGVSVVRGGTGVQGAGSKLASGSGALPDGAHTAGIGAKASAGESVLRAAGVARAAGGKLIRSGTVLVFGAARSTTAGAKLATGSGSIRAAAAGQGNGARISAGTAALRAAGVVVGTTGELVRSGAAVLPAAARALAAGGKVATGSGATRAAASEQATGLKAASGTVRVPANATATSQGTKRGTGIATMGVAPRLGGVGRKLTGALAALRSGGIIAAFQAIQPPVPTTLTGISRSPTSLRCSSRAPTGLAWVSRPPTGLAAVSRAPFDLVGVSSAPTILETETL